MFEDGKRQNSKEFKEFKVRERKKGKKRKSNIMT